MVLSATCLKKESAKIYKVGQKSKWEAWIVPVN